MMVNPDLDCHTKTPNQWKLL